MSEGRKTELSRRGLLGGTAKIAGVAGLAGATGGMTASSLVGSALAQQVKRGQSAGARRASGWPSARARSVPARAPAPSSTASTQREAAGLR